MMTMGKNSRAKRVQGAFRVGLVAMGLVYPVDVLAGDCPEDGGVCALHGCPEASWEFESTTDGICVYSRSARGSSIHEVTAKAQFDVPPARVFAVISDYTHYPEFMPYVEKSEIIRREGMGETWVFQQLALPFISDRYYTIKLRNESSRPAEGIYRIEWELLPAHASIRRGEGEPMRVDTGSWYLQPVNDGRGTRVTYFVHADPGGQLSDWIINMANTSAVPDVIMAVKKRAALYEP
jgi:ribosome-associated toxin RatA of RatAB toxin-antitoxin module